VWEGGVVMKRYLSVLGVLSVVLLLVVSSVWAQKSVRLSIATGGTGGVYYPLGGGMANIISKYIPYAEATAEVTNASVDNCRLVGMKKADLALIMADTGWDAYQGLVQFKEKVPIRALAVLYPNNLHFVTAEGRGIDKMTDLKGKRVSTGAPGSGTEIMALRALEAYGLDPDKDMKRDKLLPTESANAMKDRKIDAFFWVGGIPTAAITDLGATPGIKMKLISHADVVDKMRGKYGPLYVKGTIPSKTYPGQDGDVAIAVVWNLLICNQDMKENVAYDVIKTFFDHKQELIASHGDARYLALEPQASGGSPIPFHPGAIKYFTEKGLKIK
jgi:TRAP transporter TAXI family solute receptor